MSGLRRIWNAVRPGRVERDIEREVAFHLAERADELRAAGADPAEAARGARARFGNPTLQAERTRDADVSAWLDTRRRDLRYAIRSLARTPAFTVTAVLTLGLGIGAATAVFATLDAVLLRPLPFPDPDRLVRVVQTQERTAGTFIAPARLEDWRRLNTTFHAIAGYYLEDASETSGDLPERIRRAFVTPRFLDVWGIQPMLGRGFDADEHRFGGAAAVLVSERYWRRRLNADPGVLQRAVRVGTATIPVVGVMPATFRFPERDIDLWFPVRVDAPYAQSREATWYTGVGRLMPGVTPAQARDNLAAVQATLANAHPATDREIGVEVTPLKSSTAAAAGPSLWLLFGAVTVLLLIACTNIAALLLARAAHRQHEIAVRCSLGASRGAVAAQLFTETAVLALLGGALGVALAALSTGAIRAAAADLPRIDELAIDGRVLLYAFASTAGVALLCGLLPALRAARGADGVHGGATRTTMPRSAPHWLLAGAQVALSLTLLAGAALLIRSFDELARVERGFDTTRVLTFRMSGSWAETSEYDRLIHRIENTIDALRALPGVEAAATSGWALPSVPEQWDTAFEIVEARTAATGAGINAEGRAVSPEYFETLRIPLVAGDRCRRQSLRATGSAEGPAPGEIMVNESFARRFLAGWPSPVGLHLRDASGRPPSRIVGVVGDARERGLHHEPGPTVYWCFAAPNPTPHFLVRTQGSPEAMAQTIRFKMKELEPLRSVYDIAPLEARIGDAFAENRLRMLVLSLFAGAALSLTCIGLYGTLGYLVSLRRREIGLRLALGATRANIVGHFAGQGLRVVGLACLAGLALSLWTGRMLSGMLFGVTPSDPATHATVLVLVVAVASIAVLLPSARASRVGPMDVLREQ